MQLTSNRDAMKAMRANVHRHPEDAATRLAFINQLVAADREKKDQRLITEALEAFAPLRPLLNDLPELYYLKAALEHAGGRWSELRGTLELLLRRHPENANLYYHLAETLITQQKWSEALPIIRRYRELDPGNPGGMDFLIATLMSLERNDEAIEAAESVLRAQPDLDFQRSIGFSKHQRDAMARGLPAILVSTQFKSGTNFISDGLCKGLDLPFCWIHLPASNEPIVPGRLEVLAQGGALCQEHLLPSLDIIEEIRDSGIDRFINHVREPRQSMISAVHYQSKQYELRNFEGARTRSSLPESYGEWSLSQRLDHYISGAFVSEAERTGAWLALSANPPAGMRIRLTTFEAMKADSRRFFEELLEFYGVSQAPFDWTKVNLYPKPGDLHFRKGAADEWKTVLTPQQQRDCEQIMRDAKVDLYL